VNLAEPVPVHLTYFTTFVDDGGVAFRADVYGHDGRESAGA
jgi:murein L,D-transpeptidase YcbB/YkuD